MYVLTRDKFRVKIIKNYVLSIAWSECNFICSLLLINKHFDLKKKIIISLCGEQQYPSRQEIPARTANSQATLEKYFFFFHTTQTFSEDFAELRAYLGPYVV